MSKTYSKFIKESSDFARQGTASLKQKAKSHGGILPDEIHHHIEHLIMSAREEGQNRGSKKHMGATDDAHDRLVTMLHQHLAGLK